MVLLFYGFLLYRVEVYMQFLDLINKIESFLLFFLLRKELASFRRNKKA